MASVRVALNVAGRSIKSSVRLGENFNGSWRVPPYLMVFVLGDVKQVSSCHTWTTAYSTSPLFHQQRRHTGMGDNPSRNLLRNSTPWRSSSTLTPSVQPKDVLNFWFKETHPQNWFAGTSDFDEEVKSRFAECLNLAVSGALDEWKESARGRLALIIVFDQFSRNIHRKSRIAYSNDEKARKLTHEMISKGEDKRLHPLERSFSYLPLMHSESLDDHNLAVTVYRGLVDEYKDIEELHEQLLGFLAFEEKHKAVLEQFGRYPSRNEDLGRSSTPEELDHLSKGAAW